MKKNLLTLTLLAATLVSTQATVIFSEGFNYPDGGIVDNSAGVWVINTGNPGTCLVSNNTLQIWNNLGSTARSEDIAHQFTPGYTNTPENIYASFSAKWTGDSMPNLNGTYFFGMASAQASFYMARTWVGTTNLATSSAAPDGFFYLGIGNNSPSTATPQGPASGQLSTVPLTTNVTYTIVVRHCLTNGLDTVWVGTNPTAMTETGTTSATAGDLPSASSNILNFVNFRQSPGEGTILINGLRVGTQFADVCGANAAPQVSQIGNQALPASGTTGPLPFTIQDAETPAGSLTVMAVSSNLTVVANAGVVLGGSATNRTLTVTPVAGQQGTAAIYVFVSDGVSTSSMHFTVTVGAPSISQVADQYISTNTATAVLPFTVTDAETPNTLTVTAVSSNPTLIQNTDIHLTGTGPDRTVQVTPQADQFGYAWIDLTVTDDVGQTATMGFRVVVSRKLGLLLSEPFSYADGFLPVVSEGFWQRHSGSASDSLVVAQTLRVSYTNADDVYVGFTNGGSSFYSPVANADVLYAKFTAKFLVLPSSGGTYFAHFKDTTTSGFKGRVFALTSGAGTGKFRLGVSNGGGTTSAVVPQDLELGTTYTVVTRYSVGTAASTLWVNPTTESSSSATATDSTSPVEIDFYAFRQSSGEGFIFVDDLQVGTAFSDVVSYVSPTPIPLNIASSGGNVVLTWSNPVFTLQSAPAPTGTFTNVAGAVSGVSLPAGATQQYFRLMAP